MGPSIYALRFTGVAEQLEGAEGVLRAATSSPSSTVRSSIDDRGVTGTIEADPGGEARFESKVQFTGEATFEERGVIRFGDAGAIHFSTVGEGRLGGSPQEGVQHGCVCWRIDSGEGRYEGATGLITSNFTVDTMGTVADYQFGLIWVK